MPRQVIRRKKRPRPRGAAKGGGDVSGESGDEASPTKRGEFDENRTITDGADGQVCLFWVSWCIATLTTRTSRCWPKTRTPPASWNYRWLRWSAQVSNPIGQIRRKRNILLPQGEHENGEGEMSGEERGLVQLEEVGYQDDSQILVRHSDANRNGVILRFNLNRCLGKSSRLCGSTSQKPAKVRRTTGLSNVV